MKNLMYKELRLALHPTAPIFLLLSAMLLIPDYPYYVLFFYTGLAVFFTCLSGRENQDVLFTALLPVSRAQLVRARIGTAVLLEMVQWLCCIPFLLLRNHLIAVPNAAGMDANLALLGLALGMLGLFNFCFFTLYYRNVQKIGLPFLIAGSLEFLYIFTAELLVHTVPFFRDCLDTPDPAFMAEKLTVLAIGFLLYVVLTAAAAYLAGRAFEKKDL